MSIFGALEGRNQRFLAKYVGHDMRCLSSFVQKHAKVRKKYIYPNSK